MICGVPRTRTRIHGGDGGEAKFSSVRAARNRSYQEWAVGGVTLKESGLPDTTDDPEES